MMRAGGRLRRPRRRSGGLGGGGVEEGGAFAAWASLVATPVTRSPTAGRATRQGTPPPFREPVAAHGLAAAAAAAAAANPAT